jgi:hypothetical protein
MSDLSLKQHLIPLAKELKVKYRSRGKYELLLPLAHTLFKKSYLVPAGDDITCNYLQLERNHIKLVKELTSHHHHLQPQVQPLILMNMRMMKTKMIIILSCKLY